MKPLAADEMFPDNPANQLMDVSMEEVGIFMLLFLIFLLRFPSSFQVSTNPVFLVWYHVLVCFLQECGIFFYKFSSNV